MTGVDYVEKKKGNIANESRGGEASVETHDSKFVYNSKENVPYYNKKQKRVG